MSQTDIPNKEHTDHYENPDHRPDTVESITGTEPVSATKDYDVTAHVSYQSEIDKQIDEEQKLRAITDKVATRVNPNASGEIRFQAFTLANGQPAIRVANFNYLRGRITLWCVAGGCVIGTDPSIDGSGTPVIPNGSAFALTLNATTNEPQKIELRTTRDIWVKPVGASGCTVQLVEEFG